MLAQISSYFTGMIGLVAAGVALTLGLGLVLQTSRLHYKEAQFQAFKVEAKNAQALLEARLVLANTTEQRWKDEVSRFGKKALEENARAKRLGEDLDRLTKINLEQQRAVHAKVAQILTPTEAGKNDCEAAEEQLKFIRGEAR